MLRHRIAVLAFRFALLLAAGPSSSALSSALSNTFPVPGTQSAEVRNVAPAAWQGGNRCTIAPGL